MPEYQPRIRTSICSAALEDAGCEEIFEDHGISGIARRRPQLDRALARRWVPSYLPGPRMPRLNRAALGSLASPWLGSVYGERR